MQTSHKNTVSQLQNQIQKLEGRSSKSATAGISTGYEPLDQLLPDGEMRPGMLVEWIGMGAGTLSLFVGLQISLAGKTSLLIDSSQRLYCVALAAMGYDATKLLIVQPKQERDVLWACEEALRCTAISWVWAQLDHLSETAFRRLQLAAERSGAIGFFIRTPQALQQPSWADVRLALKPHVTQEESLGFEVEVAYCRGSTVRPKATIAIDLAQGVLHEPLPHATTHRLPMVPSLAPTAAYYLPS